MKWCIIITTYNREKYLKQLISQIKEQLTDYVICVYDDCTEPELKLSPDIKHFRFQVNNGKRGFWRVWDTILKTVPVSKYYVCLPDDCILTDNFFTKSLSIWDSITSVQKILLNIQADNRTGQPMWRSAKPIELKNVWLQHWTDFAFLCEGRLFDKLERKIIPIPEKRWFYNPSISSGVAAQISRRLQRFGMYSVKQSLIKYRKIPSLMNPDRLEKIRTI